MVNPLERLEKAAQGARYARDIDVRVERPEAAYPYLEILGACRGQLSVREAGAWKDFLDAVKPNDVLALLTAIRAFAAEECAESGTTLDRCWDHESADWPREVWCRRCKALEPLLKEGPS